MNFPSGRVRVARMRDRNTDTPGTVGHHSAWKGSNALHVDFHTLRYGLYPDHTEMHPLPETEADPQQRNRPCQRADRRQ